MSYHRFGIFAAFLLLISCGPAFADENIALYGMKGYTYTFSPLVVDGLHAQVGAVFAENDANSLECREGEVWAFPISLTYGDGDWWEIGVATHYEYFKNTDEFFEGGDADTEEDGFGDIFVAFKAQLLGQDRGKGQGLDLALMPYLLFPTGDRDKGITDLYRFVQSDDDNVAAGLFLLAGRRLERFYLAANLGFNYMSTDIDYIDDEALFFGLTLEYQVRENLTSYVEFINTESKNNFTCSVCSPCFDPDISDDIRELGVGFDWLLGRWGFKLHAGIGFSDTSPDYRMIALVNYNLWRNN